MQQSSLQDVLHGYWQRRTRLTAAVKELGLWLEASRLATPRTRAWIESALASLSTHRLQIAFLSPRGQDPAVLVDALFRDEAGDRLLPSAVLDVPWLDPSETASDRLSRAEVVVWVLWPDPRGQVAERELDLLRRQLQGPLSAHRHRLVVAWTDPGPRAQGAASSEAAALHAARTARLGAALAAKLGLEAAQVYPVWPHQALAALTRGDRTLLRQNGIEALRGRVLAGIARRPSRLDTDQARVGDILDHHQGKVAARLRLAKEEITKLEMLRDQCRTLISGLLETTRREQELHLRAARRLASAKRALAAASLGCRDILERGRMEALIERVRSELARRWTTAGMARTMMGLFDELARAMQAIAEQAEGIRQLLRRVYAGFGRDFGLEATLPQVFGVRDFRIEIELLNQEVDGFRRSPALAFSGQGSAIKRFHQQMVVRAQLLFEHLRSSFDAWAAEAWQPLAGRVEEQRNTAEQHLANLQRLGRSYEETCRHLAEVQGEYARLARQLAALHNIRRGLQEESSASDLVDQRGQTANLTPPHGSNGSSAQATDRPHRSLGGVT